MIHQKKQIVHWINIPKMRILYIVKKILQFKHQKLMIQLLSKKQLLINIKILKQETFIIILMLMKMKIKLIEVKQQLLSLIQVQMEHIKMHIMHLMEVQM